MVKFEDIEIGQMVFWVSGDSVNNGEIQEITLRKHSMSLKCGHRGYEHEAEKVFLTREEAETKVVVKKIDELKKEIHNKCGELKYLKARKADLLTAQLAGIRDID